MYKNYSDTNSIFIGDMQLDQYAFGDYIGFFCPKCFKPIIKRYALKEEFFYDPEFIVTRKFELTCPDCGHKFEQSWYLDPNITEVIALLNKKGYITEFCCEGHYTKDQDGNEYLSSTPYILFSFRKDIIFDELNLPYPWIEDSKSVDNSLAYKYDRLCIRYNLDAYDSSKQFAIDVLKEWIGRLPTKIYSYDKHKSISIFDAVKPYVDFRRSIEQFLYNNTIIYSTNKIDNYVPENFIKINMRKAV